MNEQIQTIIDRARRLLAGIAGTHVNVTLVGDRIEAHRAFHTQSPAIITTLCDALEAAERRAEDARAEQTRHLLLTTVADLKAQKAEAQSAAGRVAIRMLMEDHDPHTYSRCEDRECDHVRLAISALGDDAGRALLDRLTAAEARVADMESVREEQAAKLRRHLDEIAELQERVGLAEGREAAAKANAEQMAGWLDARNAGLVQMARERDALRAEVEALKAQRDVARQDARRAENERDALRDEAGPRLTVAELQRESYDTACAKGWHDEDETPPAPIQVIAWMGLVCSEAAEAIEDARKGRMATTIREDGKPEGIGSELADIVIRVCDSAGALGIDMEAELRAKLAFNRTRSHKHGGKLA